MLIPVAINYPKMALFEQQIVAPCLDDVPAAVRSEIERLGVGRKIRPGIRVAITAGSRGINGMSAILATLVDELKRMSAIPYIIPCMGSHGGATAEGQRHVLESLGITEQTVGAPIYSSMETVQIGTTPQGIPVLIDRIAAESDGIVVVNRIKPHTEFTGPVQSGWLKMLSIGMGKHQGALAAHRNAVTLTWRVAGLDVAREIIKAAPLLFGLGILENAYDQTAEIVAAWPEDLEAVERVKLAQATELMARLPFEQIDILIVDEIGKEISGAGMDPNVIGRRMVFGEPEPESPRITRIVVRSLTARTYGSAIGIGLADFMTQRARDVIDPRPTNINCLTAMTPEKARLPMTAAHDREALEWAFLTIGAIEPTAARVVRIKNTLHPEVFYASEALFADIAANGRLRVLSPWSPLTFDENDGLVPDKVPDRSTPERGS